jgi:hypothetical protein
VYLNLVHQIVERIMLKYGYDENGGPCDIHSGIAASGRLALDSMDRALAQPQFLSQFLSQF